MDHAAGVNIQAARRGDEVVGYRVTFSDTDNAFAKLGFQNGDILVSFQNRPLKSPEDLKWAYDELRNADSLHFRIERQGKMVPLDIELAD